MSLAAYLKLERLTVGVLLSGGKRLEHHCDILPSFYLMFLAPAKRAACRCQRVPLATPGPPPSLPRVGE